MGKPISEEGLKALKQYKYQSTGYSPLDNVFNHWWLFVVERVPKTVAPNTLTFLGTVLLQTAALLILYFDYTLEGDIPGWVYFYVFFCFFWYQTLDAIDGKQARRTNSSSPLGQLFDHGCDAFGTVMLVCTALHSIRLGDSIFGFAFLCGTEVGHSNFQFPFFLTSWEEMHTRIVRTNIGGIGVTEGQFTHFALLIGAGIFGSQIYLIKPFELLLPAANMPLYIKSLQLNHILTIMATFSVVSYAVSNISMVLLKTKMNRLLALSQLLPLCIIHGSLYFIVYTPVYTHYTALVIYATGLVFSLITTKLIVNSMTHVHFNSFHKISVLVPLMALNSYALQLCPQLSKFKIRVWETSLKAPNSLIQEELVLLAVFVITFTHYVYYVSGVIMQITSYLGIYCFSLKKRLEKED